MRYPLVGVLFAGTVLGACGDTEVVTPTIVSFTASATQVGLGDRVQLSWKVTDATAVDIDATPGGSLIQGSTAAENTIPSGAVAATTRFVLTARNAEGGSTTAEVTVNVDVSLLRIARFVATPTEIDPGESSTLSWEITGSPIGKVRVLNPAGAAIYDGVGANGTQVVTPDARTSYILEVSNIAQSITASTTVTVRANPPTIVRFNATPNPAATGARGTVAWETQRAEEVQIKRDGVIVRPWNANGAAMGFTAFVLADQSSVFTLEARNDFGEVSQDLTVTTLNPPTAVLDVTPTEFMATTATIGIHWEAANADTVSLTVGGRVPAGFTGQAMGDLVVTATRTLEVVLSAANPIETVVERTLVRRTSLFTQDVVSGDAGLPLEGAAVRVEDATGVRFYEGVTDAAGHAELEIEAEMFPVSVSVARADHHAVAVVGLAAPMTDPIRIDSVAVAPPPPMTAALQGTFFNKGAIGDRVVVSGRGVSGFDGSGISYMMDYDLTNDPLRMIALDFTGGGDLINAVVTSTVRTGAMMSVPITFPRPALTPISTVVSVRIPSTAAFAGQRYSLGGQAVVQQAGDILLLVGNSSLGSLAAGAVPWTIASFAEPGLEVSLAAVAINGTSLRVVAFQRAVGSPATIDVAAIAAFTLSASAGPLADLRVDFDGTSYDAAVLTLGSQSVPNAYRVILLGDRVHSGVRVPHLPSTVGFRGLGAGVTTSVGISPGVWQLRTGSAPSLSFADPALGYPAELDYTVERPASTFDLTGF